MKTNEVAQFEEQDIEGRAERVHARLDWLFNTNRKGPCPR